MGVEKDNENQILIKKQWICSLAKVLIERPKVIVLWGDKWQVKRDLVLKEKKVYMPKNEELRVEIIWLYHNILVAGHRER